MLMGVGLHFGVTEVLELDCSDQRRDAVSVLNVMELQTLKWLKQETVCIFYHNNF